MNSGTIFEIPFLVKAIIIWYMSILEVLLTFLGIQKRESIILHTVIYIFSFLLYVFVHYPITLLLERNTEK